MPGRWRSLSGSEHDPEKQRLRTHPDSDDFDSAPRVSCSSRGSSGSFAANPMLEKDFSPSRHTSRHFWSYQIPRKRFTHYFTLAISTSLILFIFFLVQASWTSQAEVEAGVIDMPKARPEWESFAKLEKYFSGIRTLVDRSTNDAEYPVSADVEAARLEKIAMARKASEEYRDTSSAPVKKRIDWQARSTDFDPFAHADQLESSAPVPCYLDDTRNLSAPKLLAFRGVTNGFPNPVMGSYDVVGLRDDVCFDRYGRYGPYGYGYAKVFGGSDAGLNGHTEEKDEIWADDPQIDFRTIKWADIQRQCVQANSHRFQPHRVNGRPSQWLSMGSGGRGSGFGPLRRRDDNPEVGVVGPVVAATPVAKPVAPPVTPPVEQTDVPAEGIRPHMHPALVDLPIASPIIISPSQPARPVLQPGELSDIDMSNGKRLLPRTAFVIRTWHDYVYDDEDMFNLRAMINELSIQSGGEYVVHFLVHVKNTTLQIWADETVYQQVLDDALPEEFRGMGTLWSEQQMGLIYGGLEETDFRDLKVHGVYRSHYMPLQYFAHRHPKYDFYWNWEMDIRYTGHFYHLLDKTSKWARDQPRKGLWERSARFYVPQKHGSYEDFRQLVRVQMEHGTASRSTFYSKFFPDVGAKSPYDGGAQQMEKPIWGPATAVTAGDEFDTSRDPVPPTSYEKDNYSWGVGEDADLITFNPLFDPEQSGWLLSDDVTGYNTTAQHPPRRASIGTATRLSRRLLDSMHRETAIYRRTMASEMWPATCALHHGLKAVYVPHPVYVDRAWPTSYLAAIFNNGRDGASGGARTSIYNEERKHNFQGVTWYYDSVFGTTLYKRWLGFKVDGLGGEQHEVNGEGRMCLPAMLIHPVKDIDLIVDGRGEEVQQEPQKEEPQLGDPDFVVDAKTAAEESATLTED